MLTGSKVPPETYIIQNHIKEPYSTHSFHSSRPIFKWRVPMATQGAGISFESVFFFFLGPATELELNKVREKPKQQPYFQFCVSV